METRSADEGEGFLHQVDDETQKRRNFGRYLHSIGVVLIFVIICFLTFGHDSSSQKPNRQAMELVGEANGTSDDDTPLRKVEEFVKHFKEILKPSSDFYVALQALKGSSAKLVKTAVPMGDLIAAVLIAAIDPKTEEFEAIQELNRQVRMGFSTMSQQIRFAAQSISAKNQLFAYVQEVEGPLLQLNISFQIVTNMSRTTKEEDLNYFKQECQNQKPRDLLRKIHGYTVLACDQTPSMETRNRRFELNQLLERVIKLHLPNKLESSKSCLDLKWPPSNNFTEHELRISIIDKLINVPRIEAFDIINNISMNQLSKASKETRKDVLKVVDENIPATNSPTICLFDVVAEAVEYERHVMLKLETQLNYDMVSAAIFALFCSNVTGTVSPTIDYIKTMLPPIINSLEEYVPALMKNAWPTMFIERIKRATTDPDLPSSFPLDRHCLQHIVDMLKPAINAIGHNSSSYQLAVGRKRNSNEHVYLYQKCPSDFCAEVVQQNLRIFVARYLKDEEARAIDGENWFQLNQQNISQAMWDRRTISNLTELVQKVENDLNLTLTNHNGFRTIYITRDRSNRPNNCYAQSQRSGKIIGNASLFMHGFFYYPSACESFSLNFFV